MPDRAVPASAFAERLLTALIDGGVTDVVVAPGSRSQALALAAAAAARADRLRLTVRIDERGAGFTALGIAVESRRPVVIVVTSGTAVANLHPAVLEAHHSGVPLIVVTADRPVELRGTGANQTTVQPGIFGAALRLGLDVPAPVADAMPDAALVADAALAAARGSAEPVEVPEAWSPWGGLRTQPGPVQLNLQFREPLSGTEPGVAGPGVAGPAAASGPALSVRDSVLSDVQDEHPIGGASDRGTALHPAHRIGTDAGAAATRAPAGAVELDLAHVPGTVVVAGHGAGEAAERLARDLDVPLIAEVSSGARFGPQLVAAYRPLLSDEDFGGRIRRVVVLGHPTLSREVAALLRRDDVEVIVVRSGGEDVDPGHRALLVDTVRVLDDTDARSADPDARRWVRSWVVASRMLLDDDPERHDGEAPEGAGSASVGRQEQADRARGLLAQVRRPITRTRLVDALWQVTWPHDRLVLAASRLIRVADARVPGKRVPVHANRGLAGIDGTIATAWGIAIAAQHPEPGAVDADGRRPTGTVRVLVGDLAYLHDVGSLLAAADERMPRLQVIVGDDGGGTIFDDLEVAATADPDDFRRVLRTPVRADLTAIAAAYGWATATPSTMGDLERALTTTWDTPVVIRVPLA